MKIVIVDDDKLVAMSLKMIIEASNEAEVLACGHSGKEAIKLYDEYKPDILLMDIRMEEMSGLEAGEVIIDKHEDAKLLFLVDLLALKSLEVKVILKETFLYILFVLILTFIVIMHQPLLVS
jgi:DNA-binding NarL/FixJ family response regulator